MRFNTQDLKKGDLIAVPYSNYLWPAIFAGIGKRDNPQFWLLSEQRLQYAYDDIQQGRIRKIYKDYIVRDKYKSVVKIDESVLRPSEHILYQKWMKLLTEKGLL